MTAVVPLCELDEHRVRLTEQETLTNLRSVEGPVGGGQDSTPPIYQHLGEAMLVD